MSLVNLKDNLIEIGKILKPFGVKGELRVMLYIDDSSDLANVNAFYIKDKKIDGGFRKLSFNSLKFEENPEYAKVKFDEITDRTIAESWRLIPIYLEKDFCAPPNQGEYFVRDLIGLDACYQDRKIGEIFNLIEVANQEIFVIKQESSNLDLAVPFNDRYVSAISIEEKKIVFIHLDELL